MLPEILVISPEKKVKSPEKKVKSPEKKVKSPEETNTKKDQKVFMALLETQKKFLKLTNCPWVGNKYIPNEQRFIFFVRNGERFPL